MRINTGSTALKQCSGPCSIEAVALKAVLHTQENGPRAILNFYHFITDMMLPRREPSDYEPHDDTTSAPPPPLLLTLQEHTAVQCSWNAVAICCPTVSLIRCR